MPDHPPKAGALLIGVEDYRPDTELAAKLPNTLAHLEAFATALKEHVGVPEEQMIRCTRNSDDTLGPTADDIVDAVRDTPAQLGKLDQFYVYVAGHGVTWTDEVLRTPPVDIVLGSDYIYAGNSRRAGVRLDILREQLSGALGYGDHFWFVESCRTPTPKGFQPVDPGITLERTGAASVHTLYAAEPGLISEVSDVFVEAIVDGLAGKGRAKTNDRGRWVVTFGRLASYVRQRLVDAGQEPSDTLRRGGPSVLRSLDGVGKSTCTVRVSDVPAGDECRLEVKPAGGEPIKLANETFDSPQTVLELLPNDYELEVRGPSGLLSLLRPKALPIDLFDDMTVTFGGQTSGLESLGPVPSRPTSLDIRSAPGTEIHLFQSGTLVEKKVGAHLSWSGAPGEYTVVAFDPDRGENLFETEVTVESGQSVPVDLVSGGLTATHEDVASAIGASSPSEVEFSETIGPMRSRDLSLWLGLLGAGRILAHGDGHVSHLGLPDLSQMRGSDSGLLLLSSLEDVRVTVVGARTEEALGASRVQGLESISCATFTEGADVVAGPMLIRLTGAFGDVSLAAALVPGRVTLITVVADDTGFHLRQLALPPRTCFASVPYASSFVEQPMRAVRMSLEAQARFLAQKPAEPPEVLPEDRGRWMDLLYGKWLDPIMSIVAIYDMVGRGQAGESPRDLEIALSNLRTYFGQLPDIGAIGALLGVPWGPPAGVPLFRQGWLGVGMSRRGLPPRLRRAIDDARDVPELPWTIFSHAGGGPK